MTLDIFQIGVRKLLRKIKNNTEGWNKNFMTEQKAAIETAEAMFESGSKGLAVQLLLSVAEEFHQAIEC